MIHMNLKVWKSPNEMPLTLYTYRIFWLPGMEINTGKKESASRLMLKKGLTTQVLPQVNITQVVPEVLGSSILVNMWFEAHVCAIVPTLFQE